MEALTSSRRSPSTHPTPPDRRTSPAIYPYFCSWHGPGCLNPRGGEPMGYSGRPTAQGAVCNVCWPAQQAAQAAAAAAAAAADGGTDDAGP
jgi:hypothetical protein